MDRGNHGPGGYADAQQDRFRQLEAGLYRLWHRIAHPQVIQAQGLTAVPRPRDDGQVRPAVADKGDQRLDGTEVIPVSVGGNDKGPG